MIRAASALRAALAGKPRASGDDPGEDDFADGVDG